MKPGRVDPAILDSRYTTEWLAAHPDDAVLAKLVTVNRDLPRSRGEELQLEARRQHDVWDRLGRITCPTLIAAGRWDGIAPLTNGEAIASQIRGAELRVYDGGHIFIVQCPEAISDITAFLAA